MKRLAFSVGKQLKEAYLLLANDDRSVVLDFIQDQPHSKAIIDILIVASGEAVVNLSSTVTVTKSAVNAKTQLNIQAVTNNQAHVQVSPNLQINNRLVTASHTVTTHHLSDEQLFYLTSRGLSNQQAWQLMVDNLIKQFNTSL